jgi:hypothetical protein
MKRGLTSPDAELNVFLMATSRDPVALEHAERCRHSGKRAREQSEFRGLMSYGHIRETESFDAQGSKMRTQANS